MQFKKGLGWKACYDEERNLYTAERSWRGYYQLCEIDKATYDALGAEPIDGERDDKLIALGGVSLRPTTIITLRHIAS